MRPAWFGVALLILSVAGCASSRITETPRSGVEQLLLSTAADRCLTTLSVRAVEGRKVFVDLARIEVTDKGYVNNIIRAKLGEQGALLVDDQKEAEVIAEPACGGLGTDSSMSFLGIPEIKLMIFGTGFDTPELALFKVVKQTGMAKIVLHVRERVSGKLVCASGSQSGRAYYHRYTVLLFTWRGTDIPEYKRRKRKPH